MLALFVVSFWYIKYIEGKGVTVSLEGRTFRATQESGEVVGVHFPDASYITERFSRVFFIKQSLFKPSEYKELIVDEASKVHFFKDSITISYGKLYVNLKNVQQEDEIIYFYNTPFFVKVKSGEIIIFSADTGYFLYCMRCQGDFWEVQRERLRDASGEVTVREKSVAIKPLVYKNIFFISKDNIEGEVVDQELYRLLEELTSRIKSRGKFAEDIIYTLPEEFPEPALKERKKFDASDSKKEFPELRQSIIIESFCYELVKSGLRCEKRRPK